MARTFRVGDNPGAGYYTCAQCVAYEVHLGSDSSQLPPCENCGPYISYFRSG